MDRELIITRQLELRDPMLGRFLGARYTPKSLTKGRYGFQRGEALGKKFPEVSPTLFHNSIQSLGC